MFYSKKQGYNFRIIDKQKLKTRQKKTATYKYFKI